MLNLSRPGSQSSVFSNQITNTTAIHLSTFTYKVDDINMFSMEDGRCVGANLKSWHFSSTDINILYSSTLNLVYSNMFVYHKFGLGNMKTEMYVE